MSESISIPHIKGSAIVKIAIGGDMISRLQRSLLYLTQNMSASDSLALKDKISNGEILVDKDNVIATISTLMLAIFEEAKATDQIEYLSVEDTFRPQSSS